jgi:hypothetical protein
MHQVCYDCDLALPEQQVEGQRYTCTCGVDYRLTADIVHLGEPLTLNDCRIRRFYKVLYWAQVVDLP